MLRRYKEISWYKRFPFTQDNAPHLQKKKKILQHFKVTCVICFDVDFQIAVTRECGAGNESYH